MRPARPRISLVVHDFNPGYGQGRYCLELAGRLADRFDFTVVAASFSAEARPGLTWIPVPAVRRNVVTTIATFLARCPRALREARPDLVHTQGLACWSADLITAHVCNAARLRHLADSRLRARLFTQLIAPLERAFYRQRQARRLIAISGVVASEIRRHYGWQRPLEVIHHGTDVERFRPAQADETASVRAELGLPADAWLWLFMGEAEKGLHEVIAQLKQFPAARLLVVSRSQLEPFRAAAHRLGVATRIHFHGPDPRPERLHRLADVFVYPSRYDTFGMVATEAMASGVPVILGQRIGAAELVTPDVNGLLCDPEAPDSLTQALRRLEADRDWGRRLGTAGRDAILQHTWSVCAEATARVYETVLREKQEATSA